MNDIVMISPADKAYPSLARAAVKGAPLYAVGNLALLERKAVGICGSRDASPDALKYAHEFGCESVKRGLVVVSGYAKGVDRQAHKGALEAGGSTIAILAEGITGFRVVQELRSLIDLEKNFLALSMFAPDARWQSWRAMGRNKLIVGLSCGLLVVEARERGGTINAAMECARQGKPLWAVAYDKDRVGREGNKQLLQGKAIPLAKHGDLRAALDRAMSAPVDDTQQFAMAL